MAYLKRVPWLAKDVVWLLLDARCGLQESSQVVIAPAPTCVSEPSHASDHRLQLLVPFAAETRRRHDSGQMPCVHGPHA